MDLRRRSVSLLITFGVLVQFSLQEGNTCIKRLELILCSYFWVDYIECPPSLPDCVPYCPSVLDIQRQIHLSDSDAARDILRSAIENRKCTNLESDDETDIRFVQQVMKVWGHYLNCKIVLRSSLARSQSGELNGEGFCCEEDHGEAVDYEYNGECPIIRNNPDPSLSSLRISFRFLRRHRRHGQGGLGLQRGRQLALDGVARALCTC